MCRRLRVYDYVLSACGVTDVALGAWKASLAAVGDVRDNGLERSGCASCCFLCEVVTGTVSCARTA